MTASEAGERAGRPVLPPYRFEDCDDETLAICNEVGEHVCILQVDRDGGRSWEDCEATMDLIIGHVNGYALLTDPTPITHDRLKQLGFTQIPGAREGELELGCLQVDLARKPRWWVNQGSRFHYLQYPPRSLGELRQLAMRVGVEIIF